jgi:outer membrane protein TolC
LGRGLVPPIEADRARATLANLEQQAELARAAWRVSSAELARVLRLNPTAVVVPLEPPHLLVTLISPEASVDSLVAIGLAYRPDLASHQALVQASSMRLRQEQVRPFIPSVVLQGSATPGESLGAGVYGAGLNALDHWAGRSDWDMSVLWELKNLGFGNRGLITERRGQQQQAVVEMLRAQDRVAAEVVQAHALMLAAAHRIPQAEADVRSAVVSYTGNLRGLGETIRVGDVLQLVTRPEEAVQALIQLQQAYNNYYAAVNDYNRSQFRLYYALGYPAQGLTNQPAGP